MLKNNFLIILLCLSSISYLKAKDVTKVVTVETSVKLSTAIDYHVTSSTDFGNGTVDLSNTDAWLILENIRPKTFLEKYEKKVKINGQALEIEVDTIKMTNTSIPYTLSHRIKNARISVYGQGTVIIPHDTTSYNGLEVYTGKNYTGDKLGLKSNKRYYDLGKFDDAISSFKLKRGYMATMAVESNGKGFSRVFIADTADIEITQLPGSLLEKVSFIAVFDWSWPSKKGWCSSGRNAYNEIDITESTWWYSWSADRPWLINQEYVPIKQHAYWPSQNEILNTKNATHLLGFNEPDRPEQANATVQQAINGWEDLMATGLRLGSPAIADKFSWLYEFIDECDKRNFRVDFVAIHAYWGGSGGAYNVLTNGKVDINKWYNKLKEVHERTGRPLWITEWNNGANWTNNGEPYWSNDTLQQQLQNKEILGNILHMLDTCSFVERYSLYNWVSDRKAVVKGHVSQAQIDASNGSMPQSDLGSNSAGGWVNQYLTPAGVVYRDKKSPLAFNSKYEVIHGFQPTKPIINAYCERTNEVRLHSIDYNGVMTDSFVLERKTDDGEYEAILSGEQVPEVYYDKDVAQFTKFTRVFYRVKVVVDGQSVTSEETSLDIGAVAGNQPIRATVAEFKSTNDEYFYIQQAFDNFPIVVSGGISYMYNRQTIVPVITNVNKGFFNYKIAPWSYAGTVNIVKPEEVSCLAAQEGVYNWGSLKVEAQTIANATDDWQTVTFSEPFNTIPVVFANTSTNAKDYPIVARFRNITKTGFEVRLTRELKFTDRLRTKLGWVAIEQGETVVGGDKVKVKTISNVGEVNLVGSINWDETLKNPIFLASIQTSNDEYTYGLRYYNKTDNGIDVFKQIEKSKGDPGSLNKALDAVGYVVVESRSTSSIDENIEDRQNTPLLISNIVSSSLSINLLDNEHYQVYDLQGLLIYQGDQETLDVSNLSSGLYILKTNLGRDQKFLKQ